MAFTAGAVGRVRIGGSDLNGAFFDSTIASAGTDYSQQDTAQLAISDCTSTNSTTITSVTGGFTTAMIGNAIRLSSGTGVTTGYYFITARTDTNTITVDRVSGTYTLGVGKVGGAAATFDRLINSANATGDKVVPGNTIYVRGSGSNNPSSSDYLYTTNVTPVSGNQTSGMVSIIGENGYPGLYGSGTDAFILGGNFLNLQQLYLKAGATGGIGAVVLGTTNCSVRNCVLHLNDRAIHGISSAVSCTIVNNEILSHATAPTLSTGKGGINVTGIGCLIHGNTIYRCGGSGIIDSVGNGCAITNNLILKCKEDGIRLGTGGFYGSNIVNNTIDGNGGHGISIGNITQNQMTRIYNNLITNHTVAAKAGVAVLTGTSTVNNTAGFMGNNAFYNNTSNHSGITIAASDVALGANPYTQSDPPTTNWAVGTGVKALAFPGAFQGGVSGVATTSYKDIGAVQRIEPSPVVITNKQRTM